MFLFMPIYIYAYIYVSFTQDEVLEFESLHSRFYNWMCAVNSMWLSVVKLVPFTSTCGYKKRYSTVKLP